MEEPHTYDDIIPHVFITMPIKKLDGRMMELVEWHRFNLEISIDHHALDRYAASHFRDVAERLRAAGIGMTVHAPFQELFLGAPDRLVREASEKRMDAAFDCIPYFEPRAVVMHLNYEKKRFGFVLDEWLGHILRNIQRYAERCERLGCPLTIENVYEETPNVMRRVLDELRGSGVYHCFDAGHLHAFSRTGIDAWFESMGQYIRQFHLHDNDGSGDAHRPIGSGTIDFEKISAFMAAMRHTPLVTLEPHSEPDIWRTLDGFRRTGLFGALMKTCGRK